MAIVVKRYIGTNGDILFPLPVSLVNTSPLISDKGVYYLAQTEVVLTGEPMGLLLALTYTV